MAIKRYYAAKDNTITNAYKANLQLRGVSGNMGQSDILEIFHIYGQQNSASSENARCLIQFNTDDISTDRTAGTIPASGSVSFFLKLYDAQHTQTTPKDFTLVVSAVSQSWEEGLGLDMEDYTDEDASNWISASEGTVWKDFWNTTLEGGSFKTGSDANLDVYTFKQTFDTGFEDMEIDVSNLVEDWVDDDYITNYGFGIHLTASLETGSNSYYTKKFFARGSQFFHKRPVLEARWDDSKKDNRGNLYLSSTMVPAADNLMKLYLYNVVKGELTDIPYVGTGEVEVSIYSGNLANSSPSGSRIGLPAGGGTITAGDQNTTASHVETGIYSCSFAYTASGITTIFDVWHTSSYGIGGNTFPYTEFHTGSAITVNTYDSKDYNFDQKYVSNVTNLKAVYSTDESVRFRVYVRLKDWSPTIYSIASEEIETSIIEDAYYKIVRVADNLEVVPLGTGSINHTRLSYDVSGSYFDLEMNLFNEDAVYELSLAYVINGSYVEQSEKFRFRVE